MTAKNFVILALAFFLLAFTPDELQDFRYPNLVSNSGFESGKSRWTNSGSGTFNLDTSTNLAFGVNSAAWDAAANNDTLTSRQETIPPGWYGQPCRLNFLQKGGDANLTALVIDGALATVASVVLAAQTNFSERALLFTCPTFGTLAVQFKASANAAVVYIDQAHLGVDVFNVSLTSGVTGILPLVNGGTNGTDAAVNGGLVYSDANSMEITAAGTLQDWVLSGGAGQPTMASTTTTEKTFTDGVTISDNDASTLILSDTDARITNNTGSGSDTKSITVLTSDSQSSSRSGFVTVNGVNHATNPGKVQLTAGTGGVIAHGGSVTYDVTTTSSSGTVSAVGKTLLGCNTGGGNVTLNNFSGGVTGQQIIIYKTSQSNTCTITHNDSVGGDPILTGTAADLVITAGAYGGAVLVFNGTIWFVVASDL